MSKEIELIKCIISEIDNNLYSDFGGNPCIRYTSDLKKLLLALDTPEVRHFFENYNQQDQRIAELEEQLKNAIVPKFKRGQEVYTYNKYQGCIYKLHLISIHIEQYETTEFDTLVYRARRLKDGFIGGYLEEELFATEEEAKLKLEELRGE